MTSKKHLAGLATVLIAMTVGRGWSPERDMPQYTTEWRKPTAVWLGGR
jgi:hypothetical protein